MSESKRIEIGDLAASPVYTESEYQALKKEIVLLKQALEEQRAREGERTAQLEAHKDISQLLDTGKWSDVTISVRGNNFAAHRNILSARSSTFANLLEQNHKENRLVINDLPVGVFRVLLNFIYTGKVPSLEPKMAKDLLAAADKYKLEQLKSIAEDYLCAWLSLESAASLLSLAKATNATKLKDKCLEFSHAPSSPTRPFPYLPDLCLLALFRQLPPVDQMSACNTCHRWSILVPAANRPHPRSLALSFNFPPDDAEDHLNSVSHYPDWDLQKALVKEDGSPLHSIRPLTKWNMLQFRKLKKLNGKIITQIMATFPVVKDLQLCADITFKKRRCTAASPSPLDLLVRLLEQWRSQLATLKLDVQIDCPFEDLLRPSFDRLTTAINSLPALKHLSINLTLNDKPFLLDLPIIAQLTKLFIDTKLSHLMQMLPRYVPEHSQLMQISFRSFEDTTAQLASLSPDLRRRFIHFGNLHSDYRTACNLLPSLTSVYLKLSTTTLRDLLTHASQLTQLLQLHLCIDFPAIQPDDQPHLPLPQLTSVKLLSLFFNDGQTLCRLDSHTHLEMLNLPWTMPNVQVIEFGIDPLQCTTCGIANESNLDVKKGKHCLWQIFAPLKRACTHLHTIKHDLEDILGTAEEILNG